jgi:hypothetical protein
MYFRRMKHQTISRTVKWYHLTTNHVKLVEQISSIQNKYYSKTLIQDRLEMLIHINKCLA